MAGKLNPQIVEFINYYKKKLDGEKTNKDEAVRVLKKLMKVRMTADYLKHTGIAKSVQPYREWTGEVGDLAKTLDANWGKNSFESGKKSNGSDRSHSSRNNHQSSMPTTKSVSDQDYEKKKRDSKDLSSQSTNNKKIKVDVKVVKDAQRINPDDCEGLFGSPDIIKSVNNIKPSKNNEHLLNGGEQSDKKVSGSKLVKISSNTKKSHSSKPSDLKSSKKNSLKIGDSNKSKKVTNIMFLEAINLPSLPDKLQIDGSTSKRAENGKKSKDASSKKRTKNLKSAATEEGFDANIASFEDCLGILDYTPSVKKKKSNPVTLSPQKSVQTTKSSISSGRNAETTACVLSLPITRPANSPSPSVLSKPALQDIAITSTLPEIQPNYKPMRFSIMPDGPSMRTKKRHADVSDGSFLSSRHNRTQVFSGRRTTAADVPRLFDLCIKTLQENINDLTYTGGVPFDILQPVYEKCTPVQLYNMEYYNPYLLDDTDPLWEKHCEREFKRSQRDEMETWRDLYLRLMDEREDKLKRITANISATVAKTLPVRKTKLAFLDCAAKPPRNVARKQVKLGIIPEHPRTVINKTISLKQQLVMPPPNSESITPTVPDPGSSASGSSQQKAAVKKVAPLMQKTLKCMRNRYRR